MPVGSGPFYTDVLVPWIEGLLPDNSRVRQSMAREASCSATNPFELLEYFGRDCPGAVQICSPLDVASVLAQEGDYEPISCHRVWSIGTLRPLRSGSSRFSANRGPLVVWILTPADRAGVQAQVAGRALERAMAPRSCPHGRSRTRLPATSQKVYAQGLFHSPFWGLCTVLEARIAVWAARHPAKPQVDGAVLRPRDFGARYFVHKPRFGK